MSGHLVDTVSATGTQTFPCVTRDVVTCFDTVSSTLFENTDTIVASGTAIWTAAIAEVAYGLDAPVGRGPWSRAVVESTTSTDVTNGVGPQTITGTIAEAAYPAITLSVLLVPPWRYGVVEAVVADDAVAVPEVSPVAEFITIAEAAVAA